MPTSRLALSQQAALSAITVAHAPVTVPDLAIALGTAPEGASQTAASLVRRGLVDRVKVAGRVAYRVRAA